MVAATTSGSETADSPVSPRCRLKSAGLIYILGKPTQTKVVARILVSPRKKIQRGFFFSFLFLCSEKGTKKKALNRKRIAERRRRREENITGGQLSGLFLEDCFSILQSGWKEQGGSVWQLDGGGGWRQKSGGGRSEWVHRTSEPTDRPTSCRPS